jgi:hypothetical protein
MLLESPGPSLGLCGSLGLAASLGLDKPPGRGILGSPVIQIPEKSGLPFANRGEGADMSTLPSAFRGTPAVGYFTHCAFKCVDANAVPKMTKATVTIAL